MSKRKLLKITPQILIILLLVFLFSSCTSDINHTNETQLLQENVIVEQSESDDKVKDTHIVTNTVDENIVEEYTINDSNKGLTVIDFDNAYGLCVLFLNECYYAAYSPTKIDSLNLDRYVRNKNFKKFIYEKLQFNIEHFSNSEGGKLYTGLIEVEWYLNNDSKYVHFSIVTRNSTNSSVQQLIVFQANGKLYISDWYSGPLAMSIYSLDDELRRDVFRIDNPNIWDDEKWVDEIFAEVDKRKQNKP